MTRSMRTRMLLALTLALGCSQAPEGKSAGKAADRAGGKKDAAGAKAEAGAKAPKSDKVADARVAKDDAAAPSPNEDGADPKAEGDAAAAAAAGTPDPVLDHEVKLLDGSQQSLDAYRGKALLVVNTASECGYTPQYADLQEVYAKYKDEGLEVLAFPSNDFGGQEPGTPEEIRSFVDDNYSVEFTIFDKVHARGDEISPLYKTLTQETTDTIKGEVKWNFTKFLIDPEGKVVARFEPKVKPTDPQVTEQIEQILPKG